MIDFKRTWQLMVAEPTRMSVVRPYLNRLLRKLPLGLILTLAFSWFFSLQGDLSKLDLRFQWPAFLDLLRYMSLGLAIVGLFYCARSPVENRLALLILFSFLLVLIPIDIHLSGLWPVIKFAASGMAIGVVWGVIDAATFVMHTKSHGRVIGIQQGGMKERLKTVAALAVFGVLVFALGHALYSVWKSI